MKLYTKYTLLSIILVSLFCVLIIVVCDGGFIEFIKNKHTLLTMTGRRKTQEWLDTYGSHDDIVKKYFMRRQTWLTSNLGTYLFKNIDDTIMERLKKPDRFFKILIWRYWDWLKRRHSKYNEMWNSSGCAVDNCRFSGDFDLDSADAVVVHIQKGLVPKVDKRNTKQIWIMLTDESPQHTFSLAKNRPNLTELADVFNWSMTYRSDSDIPVPYGRTLPLRYPKFTNIISSEQVKHLVPFWEQKQDDVLGSILMSNCGVRFRNDFLKELNKHMDIDVLGGCSSDEYFKKSCPGHWKHDCPVLSEYFFYLVFENSKCRQYLTEKIYQNAFEKGAIPVILGPPVEDCKGLLPPGSFLHVDDFKNPRELALEMVSLSNNKEKLLSYHAWRNNFKVIGEHGYFDKESHHLCRICEALNYNDDYPKVYSLEEIQLFLDPRILCS